MRSRIIVIISSSILAFFIMSGGYGFWSRPLKIQGTIDVVSRSGSSSHNSFALLSMENVSAEDVKYKTVAEDVYSDDKYENVTESRQEFGDSDLLEYIEDYQKLNE